MECSGNIPVHLRTPTVPADARRFSRARDGGSSIIPALLFGDRYGLNTPDMERINAGLTHSLALSGQHLASVVGLGALALTGIIGAPRRGCSCVFHSPASSGLSLPLASTWYGSAMRRLRCSGPP